SSTRLASAIARQAASYLISLTSWSVIAAPPHRGGRELPPAMLRDMARDMESQVVDDARGNARRRQCSLQGAAQLEVVRGLFLFLRRAPFLRRWLVHHAFELHAVGIREIDRIVRAAVIFPGRIDHVHPMLGEKSAERVHVVAARKL